MDEDEEFLRIVGGFDGSAAGTPLHEWLGCPQGQLSEFILDEDDEEPDQVR